MNRSLLLTLLLIGSLTLAACGREREETQEAPAAEAPAAESISVVMHDIYYGDTNDNVTNPPSWTVTSGAEVTVNMDNQGALQHNFAIVKPGEEVPQPFLPDQHMDIVLIDPGLADPQQTKSVTFTAPEPGEYTVICTVAGHYPLMQGRLTVK